MPPKGSTGGRNAVLARQLSEARAKANSKAGASCFELEPTVDSLQECLGLSEAKVRASLEKIGELEAALQTQQQLVAQLSQALDDKIHDHQVLIDRLASEQAHSKGLYQSLRTERHARQRGQTWKGVLDGQIKLLKSAEFKLSTTLKTVRNNASKAIDSLMRIEKQNVALRSNLSLALQRCVNEAQLAKKKIDQAQGKAKEQRRIAANLKRRWASRVQENALQRAKERLKKESSVHKLLHKGAYNEKTRSLIRLLVQAGCSRPYVDLVIHEVFKTAGISVHGHVSRCTVSRVVLEGYFAAQMQLGYEMQQAKSESTSWIHVVPVSYHSKTRDDLWC